MCQRNILPPSSGSMSKPSKKLACSLLLLVTCLAYSLIQMMEVIGSTKTLGFLQATRCYNQEYHVLPSQCTKYCNILLAFLNYATCNVQIAVLTLQELVS
jgi:hypothetical protein